MIDAKELRIGNIVEHRNNGKITVDIANIVKISRSPLFFNPIELTEKWLIDFGFNRDGSYMSHIFMNLTVEENKFGEEIILIPNQKYCKELKYVHQLQNLFFALTGKELEMCSKT